MQINIHSIINDSKVNGPGSRCVVWTQGCSKACKGCFNPETWNTKINNLYEVEDLYKLTLPQFRVALIETMTDPNGKIAGAVEKMAKTWEGQVSMMEDAILELKVAIGNSLAPSIQDLMTGHFSKPFTLSNN